MALEKFEYPHTGTVTASWLPTRNPSYDGAGEKRDRGVLSDQSAGNQAYRYEEGRKLRFYRRSYNRLATSEKSSFETFRDTVGGKKLKYTDPAGATHTVTFEEYVDEFKPSVGDRWSFTITMREEA